MRDAKIVVVDVADRLREKNNQMSPLQSLLDDNIVPTGSIDLDDRTD